MKHEVAWKRVINGRMLPCLIWPPQALKGLADQVQRGSRPDGGNRRRRKLGNSIEFAEPAFLNGLPPLLNARGYMLRQDALKDQVRPALDLLAWRGPEASFHSTEKAGF